MRKGRFLKYLLAMVVAFSTSLNVRADEATYKFNYESSTVTLQTIQAPGGTTATLNAPFKRAKAGWLSWLVDNYRDRVYLENKAGGSIDFTGFKYEVTAITMSVMANPKFSGDNIYTDVKNYTYDESSKQHNTFRIGVLQGDGFDFGENKFINRDMTPIKGLGQLYLKGLSSNNPAFFRGANDNTTPTFRITYVRPEIRIRFASGNKGYDVTVGDNNAQIEGYISGHAGAFVVGIDNVYFKYTSSNSAIAEIDPTTGKIKANAEGDTEIKATLIQKVGETEYDIASYPYNLHVFAIHEGLEWQQGDVFRKGQSSNASSWQIGNTSNTNNTYDWNVSGYLKTNTTIWENSSKYPSGTDNANWKQIVSLTTPESKNWRSVVQMLSFSMLVPKYSTAEASFNFAANFTIGAQNGRGNNKYGYQVVDFGEVALSSAIESLKSYNWDTSNSTEEINNFQKAILRNGADRYTNYVGSGKNGLGWLCDNKEGSEATSMQRHLAVMAYLWGEYSYPGEVSVGYKSIPTYKYYAYIDFYSNYKDNTEDDCLGRETMYAESKTESKNLNKGNVIVVPNRPGYKMLGWSTDKNAKTAEYPVNGDFYPYDSENGGGKGEVKLYAVWQANSYKIILDKQNGQPNATFSVTYGQKIPNVSVPTREGYAFRGYWTEAEYSQQTQESQATDNGEKYYNNKGVTSVIWDRTEDLTLYAHWSRKTAITFDLQGGYDWATTSAIATNGEEMPGIITPQRGGHTFVGYYEQPDGKGIQYYRSNYGNAVSARIWDKDVDHATLYAQWEPKPLKLRFTYPSGEERLIEDNKYNSSKYSSLAGAKDKNGSPIEKPKKEGFLFEGWEKQGVLVYDGDGNAVEGAYWAKNSDGILVWNCTDDQTDLTARWIEAVEVATVSIQVIRDKNYENGNIHRYVGATISGVIDIADFKGDGYITVDGIHYLSCEAVPNGDDITDNLYSVKLEDAPIWHFEETTKQDAKTGLPAYNIYTVKDGQRLYLGNRVVKQPNDQVEIMYSSLGIQTSEPEGKFTIYDAGEGKGWVCFNENSRGDYNHVLYMQTNSEHYWELENSHNNSQYKPIKLLSAGHIISGDMSTQKIISSIKDELVSPGENKDYPYAYNVDGTPNINDEDLCKGLLYVDMSTIAEVVEEVGRTDLSKFAGEVSDNCLFFMPKSYSNVRLDNSKILADNVIRKLTNGFESVANLVITDKVPFSSPYTFSTGSHTASYSRETSDKWGSLCLPFPVNRSGINMKFYNLYGSDDIRLAFKSDDGTNDIPANEPIACYGSGSFTLTSNSNAVVPADNTSREYDKEVTAISCENIRELVEDKKQMITDSKPWNFKGVRFDSYVYGTEYTGTLPNCPNCAKKSLVYYFSKDKFTYVNSKGRVKFAPFRAYLQAPEGSSAKTFSLLVFDEDGATDITEIIDGNAGVANGKIYDLLGRRVKTPLKGHIYIVDGKKKQY